MNKAQVDQLLDGGCATMSAASAKAQAIRSGLGNGVADAQSLSVATAQIDDLIDDANAAKSLFLQAKAAIVAG